MAAALTTHGPEGTPLKRSPEIDDEIDAALLETTKQLLERAHAGARELSSETLLHLIREAQQRGNRGRVNSLLDVWLERCAGALVLETPDVREDVMDRISGWIAQRHRRLDFFEVRFGAAMRNERMHSRRTVRSRSERLVDESAMSEEPSMAEDEIALERTKAETRAAIRMLPGPLYVTATLVWVFAFSIVETADALEVDESTVRHRLKRAAGHIKATLEKP